MGKRFLAIFDTFPSLFRVYSHANFNDRILYF
jgi:hypothetical protein